MRQIGVTEDRHEDKDLMEETDPRRQSATLSPLKHRMSSQKILLGGELILAVGIKDHMISLRHAVGQLTRQSEFVGPVQPLAHSL